MHLVDHARRHIEETYVRPWPERALRAVLTRVLPSPTLFRLSLRAAALARPLGRLIPGRSMTAQRLRAMLALAPASLPPRSTTQEARVHPAEGTRRGRVGLLTGCAQKVLNPAINEATIRLLTRMGIEVVVTPRPGLLRRVDAPHGPARPGHGGGARQHRRLGRGEAGRHRRQRLGLRHDPEGLRPHVPRGAGGRRRRPRVRAGDGRDGGAGEVRLPALAPDAGDHGGVSLGPARSSTGRRSRRCPSSCWRARASG
jgi:hypothetical protein